MQNINQPAFQDGWKKRQFALQEFALIQIYNSNLAKLVGLNCEKLANKAINGNFYIKTESQV